MLKFCLKNPKEGQTCKNMKRGGGQQCCSYCMHVFAGEKRLNAHLEGGCTDDLTAVLRMPEEQNGQKPACRHKAADVRCGD